MKNRVRGLQLKTPQAGAGAVVVLPAPQWEHPKTALLQRRPRKWDKTAPSHPGVADMKDTVLPFERLRATVFEGTRPQ